MTQCLCVQYLSLHRDLETYIYCAWLGWAIEIARVAKCATVKVFLECIQNILYSGIHLHIKMMSKREGICNLGRQLYEIGRMHHYLR